MDRLAYPPSTGLQPVAASRGDMTYLPCVILSCHCRRRWRLTREGKLPGHRYSMESLSALIPVLFVITHGKSFLLGDAYALAGS
jgi:hypothetical protein